LPAARGDQPAASVSVWPPHLASQWQHADWLAHGLVLLLQRMGHVNLDSRAAVEERVFDTMQELDQAGMRFSLLPVRMSWQTRAEQP